MSKTPANYKFATRKRLEKSSADNFGLHKLFADLLATNFEF